MITVHHLNNSRSQRILWLLEELALPYEIKRYERDAVTSLAPPELLKVHPLGKSPVITDGGATASATSYDWLVSNDNGTTWTEANGINGQASYTPVEGDEGQLLKVELKFTDASGNPESSEVSAGRVQENPTENAAISLSGLTNGNAVEGTQVTATVTEADAPASGIVYTWFVGGHAVAGVTGNTYTPSENDEGQTLSVSASFTDTHGFAEQGSVSAGTVQESPTENASISLSGLTNGNAVEGQKITATVTDTDAPASGIVRSEERRVGKE